MVIVEVIALFLLRIGVPLLCLVGLGHLIDRWQCEQLEKHNNQ